MESLPVGGDMRHVGSRLPTVAQPRVLAVSRQRIRPTPGLESKGVVDSVLWRYVHHE